MSMASLTTTQSQVVLQLGSLTSLWNTVRATAQNSSFARPWGRKTTIGSSTGQDWSAPTLVVPESVRTMFQELGLSSLTREMRVEILPAALKDTADPASDSFISTESFFKNKNGFSEKDLTSATFCNPPAYEIRVSLPNLSQAVKHQYAPQIWHQQSRGFKTRRSTRTSGFGEKRAEDTNFISNFFKINVLDKLSPQNKMPQVDKFKSILQDHNDTPDVQNRMKVAFAEGYAAHNKRDADPSTSWTRRGIKIVFYAVLIWIAFQLIQGYSPLGGNVKINVLKGERYEVNPEDISITFDDVKGVDEAKQELQDIVEYLQDPDKFRVLGAKLPKGVLLVGPPGIGKTLLARAVAGEAGVPFFQASGSEFDEIFVGTGAKRVRQLFDAAKIRAPCVIFIDEIDTVGAKRTSSQIHPYANQTINQLLSEMDGFMLNEGVIVLGATNRRDNLDQALLRPGRFDVEVRVFPPDLKGRTDILELYLMKVKRGPDVDVERLARGTTGCTGADLENLVNQAALKGAMDNAPLVTMAHLEYARDKVLMGPAKKTRIQDEETNICTAYHEAGHTLVAYHTSDATALHKVTIVPRGTSLGHTSMVPEKEMYNQTKSQLLAQMDVAMGGRVAEELTFGSDKVTTGASSDFRTATAIATAMVKQLGMSEKVGVRVFSDEESDTGLSLLRINDISQATADLVDNEIKRLLQESYDRAKTILKNNQTQHKALAQALLKYETLDADEIRCVVEGKKLHRPLTPVYPAAGNKMNPQATKQPLLS